MRQINCDEVVMVSGGDRGDAAVAGAIAGGMLGYGAAAARGASYGVRAGAFFGPVGAIGGGLLGMVVAVAIYDNYM